MVTRIVVPIAAENPDEAKKQIKAALAAGAEMLELRSDYLEELSVDMVKDLVAEVRKTGGKKVPIIVTCRDKKQGGARKYPDQLRADVLAGALKAGVEFVDFEYENYRFIENQERLQRGLSQNSKARLILSAHNFERKFDNINKVYRGILNVFPAAVPKLVYTANHINDCFEGFDLLHQTGGERIVFCMGEAGLISRIIAKKLGSLVTFASIDEKTATAPGQLTIKQLKKLYRFDSIDSETELFGVIAEPVGHSLSPAIHNACFAEKNMNKLYLPLLVKGGQSEFDSFLNSVIVRKWLSFRGFSVTIPHKQNALNYVRVKLGFIEPLAEKIGAINTLVIKEGEKTAGYNTDYAAALDSITSVLKIDRVDLKELPVAVVGAGGVARAIVACLSDAGAKIKIYNRTIRKAERLAAEFDCDFAGLDELKDLDAKLAINCTSIGMYPNVEETPLPEKYLKKDMVIFDTVCNPAETLLLKQAKKKRLKRIDGLSMFVNQAMAQFKLFTGKKANAKLMRKTIANRLSSKAIV
jgi:3-dehydroquinate dehydratase/shikimate dehydrogenase